jgi:hypothetical protein
MPVWKGINGGFDSLTLAAYNLTRWKSGSNGHFGGRFRFQHPPDHTEARPTGPGLVPSGGGRVNRWLRSGNTDLTGLEHLAKLERLP